MAKLRLEKWKSNINREDHYYIQLGREHYLCGFNPRFFSKKKIKKILKMIKL